MECVGDVFLHKNIYSITIKFSYIKITLKKCVIIISYIIALISKREGDDFMIFGLEPHVFFAFLSWPVTYIIIAIIMYFVMGAHDKKEEEWERAYDEWQKSKGGETE